MGKNRRRTDHNPLRGLRTDRLDSRTNSLTCIAKQGRPRYFSSDNCFFCESSQNKELNNLLLVLSPYDCGG
jgi:hypothetical protein